MKKILAVLIKGAISITLLYFALRSVNFTALSNRLAHLDPAWAAGAIALLCVQLVIVALRWQRIAVVYGAPLSARDAVAYTFIGMFFNQTLPSTVGGDVARIWFLGRIRESWRTAAYSVLIDRAAGLIWLALLVLACLPWSLRLVQNPTGQIALIAIGAAGVIGPVLLFAITRGLRSLFARTRVTSHIAEIAAELMRVVALKKTALIVAALSVASHLLTAAMAWVIAKAIGAPLGLTLSLLLIPPVILISAIPISIAGWGLRESLNAKASVKLSFYTN